MFVNRCAWLFLSPTVCRWPIRLPPSTLVFVLGFPSELPALSVLSKSRTCITSCIYCNIFHPSWYVLSLFWFFFPRSYIIIIQWGLLNNLCRGRCLWVAYFFCQLISAEDFLEILKFVYLRGSPLEHLKIKPKVWRLACVWFLLEYLWALDMCLANSFSPEVMPRAWMLCPLRPGQCL